MPRTCFRAPIAAFPRLIALLILASMIAPAAAAAPSKDKKGRRTAPNGASAVAARIAFESAAAERYGDAVRIVWRTSFERNGLGFRVWRQAGGVFSEIGEAPVPAGGLRARDTVLAAGSEYHEFDLSAVEGASYWVEAVGSDGRSVWAGPVLPVAAADSGIAEQIAGRVAAGRLIPEQVDRAEFERPQAVGAGESAAVSSLLAENGNAVKMEIRRRGIHRITGAELRSVGIAPEAIPELRLFNAGVEQPISVDADGSVQFFGEGIETFQTDAAVYWLTTDVVPGRRIARNPQNYQQDAREAWHLATAEKRERNSRLSGILNGPRENWFGPWVSNTPSVKTLELRNVDFSSNRTATVGGVLQGAVEIAHQVAVRVNGTPVGQVNFAAFERKEWSLSLPLEMLVEGTNTISFQSLNTTSDFSVPESVRITYPQKLRAVGDRIEFSVASPQPVKVSGFSGPAVRVFDITNPEQVSEIVPESRSDADGTHSITVAGSLTPRLMLAIGEGEQLYSVSPLVLNTPSRLRDPANQAKLVVIAPREFFKPLFEFRDRREQEGIRTMLVDIEDIYDEFNAGVVSAEAIRDFLSYSFQNWSLRPEYVLLAGDASSDPKNYSGLGGRWVNRIPSLFVDTWNMEAPTDELLVDFNGDSIGEMMVGRLPAENREQLQAMVEKVLNTAPMSREEIASRGVHFVSDDTLGYDFAAASRAMAATLPAPIAPGFVDRVPGADAGVLRTNLIARINSGAAIVNFFGHGSTVSWTGAGLLRTADVPVLFNAKRTPLVVALACLNGEYTIFGATSIGESLMKKSMGGAFAVWAASGWNGAYEEDLMGRDLYPRLFAGRALGDVVREVKSRYPTVDMRRTFILFGDPTQRLVR